MGVLCPTVSVWHSGPTPQEPWGDCPGKAGSLAPCLGGGSVRFTACHPSITLCSQGAWRTVHSRADTRERERPQGWRWPWFLHHCIGKIGWEGARQAGERLTLQGTKVGGDQRTVEAWGRKRDWAFICYSEPVVQLEPGRRARGSTWNHTRTARDVVSAHLHESSHQTPMEHSLQAKWSLWEGVLLERTILMIIKTLVLTCNLHLHRTRKVLKQTQPAKAAKEEVKRVHLFEANTSYLCFIRGFLLSWHCVIYIFNLTRCPLLCKIYTSIERLWNTQGNNFSVDWVLNGKTSLNAILQIRRSPAF